MRKVFAQHLSLATVVAGALWVGCSSSDELDPAPTGASTTSSATSSSTGGSTTTAPYDGPLLGGDCDPMVPSKCGFPFPSSVYLTKDATTATGLRVAFGATTLPLHQGKPTDPSAWNDSDGFSTGQAPMTHMPGATSTGLPTQHDLDRSLADDSPTILIDASTGERVPHFAELDMSAGTQEDSRALLIRPVVRLKDATRYVVAIRHVVDSEGHELAPSPVFQALRDGTDHEDVSVERRRALYDDLFTILEGAGVPKGDLQIAWDYTTASRDNNTRWLLAMRDDALAKVGEEGPEYVIDTIEDDPNEHIRRRIHGRMTVPLYLDTPDAGAKLVFGPDGLPQQNGTAEFEFIVHVPNSAVHGTPGALAQTGHGLLGNKEEGENGYIAKLANSENFVVFGVDLVGMAEEDEDVIRGIVAKDIGAFKDVVGRQHQGIVNSLLAMRMMRGRFWKDEAVTFDGQSAIDPSEGYYRGDSQGGIFGATYMAVSTDVTRGLLGEPGMPYNLLLNRSVDFSPFFFLLHFIYADSLDIQLALGVVQMHWDRTEPNGYAPYVNGEPLPGTPSHEVLIHVALGDHQVTPLGAHILARAVGAKNIAPVNRSVWGVDEVTPPYVGSGLVEFEFGNAPVPDENTPPNTTDEDPHDKVRELDAAIRQAATFLRTGTIEGSCEGPCDPE
jgi:hypothetical protein